MTNQTLRLVFCTENYLHRFILKENILSLKNYFQTKVKSKLSQSANKTLKQYHFNCLLSSYLIQHIYTTHLLVPPLHPRQHYSFGLIDYLLGAMAHLITSSTPANTHVFFAGIVVLKAVPENITTIRMVCEVASHGNRIENLPNLIQEETGIPMTIDYYNRFRLEFPQGAIAFVQGVLSMEPAQATGASPKVLIRADQLVP